MTILEIMQYCGEGGILLFILLTLVEIAPIKINPIGWLGKRLNSETIKQTEEFRKDMTAKVAQINNKLDEHIAEDYRNNILIVQDKLLRGRKFTREEWNKALSSCQQYEKYIEDNHLKNDQVNEAMSFIKRSYRKCLDDNSFYTLPFTSSEVN